MRYMEFGVENPQTIMLLHGGGLSWWNYRDAAMLLQEKYRVVLPVMDGHGDSEVSFRSIEENAEHLIRWIDEAYGGHLLLLGGVSLGGQIAAEILARRPDICDCAFLESVLVEPMKLTAALIGPTFAMSYGLIRKPWFSRMQAAYLGIPKELYEYYYRDTCKISREDLIAFLESNSRYTLKEGLADTKAKVSIVAGSRELPSMIRSARKLNQRIPGSTLEILPGMCHGELSLNRPAEFVCRLESLIHGK